MTGMCLVTGAAGGIGKSIVQRLANDGYRLLAADISAAGAEASLDGLSGSGHRPVRRGGAGALVGAEADGIGQSGVEVAPVGGQPDRAGGAGPDAESMRARAHAFGAH